MKLPPQVPQILLAGLIAAFWGLAAASPNLDIRQLAGDGLLRIGMNGIFVLALVPPLCAGLGINFGLPLGFIAGLAGVVTAMELRQRGWCAGGWPEFTLAAALAVAAGAALGYGYSHLLERVRGQELMVGFYVGLAAVAAMSIVWLIAPYRSPELIYPIGGQGLKQTIPLDGHFEKILDHWGWKGQPEGGPPAAGAPPAPAEKRPLIPAGLLGCWLAAGLALAGFLRTRAGIALSMAGGNPRFAHIAGAGVPPMRRLAVILSTALAAFGMVVFVQSLGLVQLYKAPLGNTLPAVAAILIGGATLKRATVLQALAGAVFFQLLLVISPPVINDLVQRYSAGRESLRALENLPDIIRVLILNGFILYALTRGGPEGER